MRAEPFRPSFKNGFARSPGESANPDLWRGLVGSWLPSMGPTGLTLRDLSGRGNHGTLTNMDPATDWVIGGNPRVPGYAIDFNGSNARIKQLDIKVGLNQLIDFTFSAWVNPDSLSTQRIFSAGSAEEGLNEYSFLFIGDKLAIQINNTGQSPSATTAVSANVWTHVVATFIDSADSVKFYINGIQDATTPTNTDSIDNSVVSFINIGSSTAPNQFFDGQLQDIRIYDRALPHNEVRQLHDDPLALFRLKRRASYFVPVAGFLLSADSGSYDLTGTDASLKHDSTLTADSGSYALTGTDAGLRFDAKIDADSGSYALTGTDASLEFGHAIDADSGSYSLTGTDASLELGHAIDADPGSYALVGTDATLTLGQAITLTADSGSYALTGTDAALLRGHLIAADADSYTLLGTDAALLRGHLIAADAGSYTITGTDAALLRSHLISADAGAYTLTGTDAALDFGHAIDADFGVYALTGTDAGLIKTFILSADSGSYALAGTDAALLLGHAIDADSGSYALTGTDAGLIHGRGLVADSDSYALTGSTAELLVAYKIDAASGVYTLTGSELDTSLFGGSITKEIRYSTIHTLTRAIDSSDSPYQVLSGTTIRYDSNAGLTFTLPPSPIANDWFVIKNQRGTLLPDQVTLDPGVAEEIEIIDTDDSPILITGPYSFIPKPLSSYKYVYFESLGWLLDHSYTADITPLALTPLITSADSPYQASGEETVLVNTVLGNVTVLTPTETAGPVQDMRFRVKKVSVDEGIVTIDAGAGRTIETPLNIASDTQSTFLVGGAGAVAEWKYADQPATWVCTGASKVAAWVEAWTATAITGVASNPPGSTIVWTFVPFFAGQVPLIATHSAGTFTFQSDGVFNISVDIVFDFVATSGNSEAQMRLIDNFTPITQNEIQTVTITGTPTGGTFTLTFVGEETGPIAFDATAAEVDTALEALLLIGAGDVTCTGGPLPGTAVACEFTSALANTNVPQMIPDSTLLTGGTSPTAAVATTQGGNSGTGNETVLDIISSFQSSRSGTFGMSANTGGTSAPNPGDTTSFTIGEDFATGMTIDLIGGLLLFDTG